MQGCPRSCCHSATKCVASSRVGYSGWEASPHVTPGSVQSYLPHHQLPRGGVQGRGRPSQVHRLLAGPRGEVVQPPGPISNHQQETATFAAASDSLSSTSTSTTAHTRAHSLTHRPTHTLSLTLSHTHKHVYTHHTHDRMDTQSSPGGAVGRTKDEDAVIEGGGLPLAEAGQTTDTEPAQSVHQTAAVRRTHGE